MTTSKKISAKRADLEELLKNDGDCLKVLMKESLQEVLEAEMTEALGAASSERAEGRLGYRAGYYGRRLVTRIGKLELRVPRDREGRFSTELFERYQRWERRWSRRWPIGMCRVSRRARSKPSPKSCAVMSSRRVRSAR